MLTYMAQVLIALTAISAIALLTWVLVENRRNHMCSRQFADLDFPENQLLTVLRMWRPSSALRYRCFERAG